MYGSSGSFEGERRGDELPGAPQTDACAQIRPLLPAFHTERLDADRRDAVMQHIAGCADCAARLDALREEDYAILRAASQPQPPANLRQSLFARIAAEQANAQTSPTALSLTRQQKGSRPMRTHEPIEASAGAQETPTGPRHPHSRSRLGVWMGAIAAALIVALLGGVFVTLARSPHQGGIVTTHKEITHPNFGCQSSQITASLPDGAMIGDIAMTSDDTGWAVGVVSGNTSFSAMILSYSNCTWRPFGAPIPNATLSAISMVSNSDGWAVGGLTTGGALALHFTNGRWQQVAIPSFGYRFMGMSEVYARSADDVWFRANYQNNNIIGISYAAVLHYRNGAWSVISSPFTVILSIAPVGPDEFWAVVSSDTPDVVTHVKLAHYVNGGWTTFTVPGVTIEDTLTFSSPSDGWAYTSDALITSGFKTWPLFHYDGSHWSQVTNIAPPTPTTLAYFTGAEGWAGAPTNTVPNGVKLVAHYIDGTWQTVSWPLADVQWSGSLACASTNDCWAVGDKQTSVTNPDGTTSTTDTSVLLRYTTGAWTSYG
ncbi:MAG: zf-HC2 domain-containing protein [Ktedonobacterales bacterium]